MAKSKGLGLSFKMTSGGPAVRANAGPIQVTKGPRGTSVMYKDGGTKIQKFTPKKK